MPVNVRALKDNDDNAGVLLIHWWIIFNVKTRDT